jgi:subtilase family serine protease
LKSSPTPTPADSHGASGSKTVAIIELGGGYRNSDLQAFFHEIETRMPNVSAVSMDHAGNDPTTPDSADGEVMLDIEVAGAVVPGANIVVYFAPNRVASGGGVSVVFPVPPYQAKAQVPVSLDNGKQGRGVPDIAMSATDYFTRVDNSEGASGGTSAVAPLMAALVALLNQAKGKRVGFLNPFLYANTTKGVVHDVTSGTNAIKNTTKGYKAGPG